MSRVTAWLLRAIAIMAAAFFLFLVLLLLEATGGHDEWLNGTPWVGTSRIADERAQRHPSRSGTATVLRTAKRALYAQRVTRNVSVTDYLDDLDHRHADAVVVLRQLILDAVPGIHERIKWNAPSFGPGDDDRVTMRLQPRDCLQLVLHRGVDVKDASTFSFDDPAELVVWRSRDRGVVTLSGLSDVEERRDSVSDLVRRWVAAT